MLAFLAALPAFVAALPTMFQLALKFMSLAETLMAWAGKNNLHQWFDDVEGAIDNLEKAKSADAKTKAAKDLSDIIGKLR